MALGRSRSSKRSSSSSSYTSTITTIAFVALCVIGVWMLTSNYIVPPQATTRATKPAPIAVATKIAATTSSIAATDTDLASTSELPQSAERVTKKDQPIFEDNPGDLPADAIKSDDLNGSNENDKEQKRETSAESSNAEENSESLSGKESTEEQEKQSEKQTQISEESSSTQSQRDDETNREKTVSETNGLIQEITDEKSDSNQEQNTDTNGGDVSQEVKKSDEEQQLQQPDIESVKSSEEQEGEGNVNTSQESQDSKSFEEQQQRQRQEDAGIQTVTQEPENQVTEEDNQKRMEQQQQQQEQQKQDQNLINLNQQQHVEKPSNNADVDETSPGTRVENQETQQESQSENKQDTTAETGLTGSSGIPKESKESKKTWSTQATESENQIERRKEETVGKENVYGYNWELCNVTAGPDYIPCLDNEKVLKKLRTTGHFEHRERHCPKEGPTCLVPVPENYKRHIQWPASRDKIWYHNVPHTTLAEFKGHQNWVKVTGEFLTFPGGGTQFIHGALHYIEFIEKIVPKIAWGKRTRVILDVGCGVASFGGYLFDKDVLTMSFAPKDEHEAQIQFALERGIPAISAVMGTQRLPFPSRVFDIVHCARCRVPWEREGGMLLLELNRMLRPGGYFVWSATPVYQKLEEDVAIWQAMSALTVSMCWELVTIKKDKLNSITIGAAIYRKPTSNDCYDQRKHNKPPMCKSDDDANAAWYVPLQACMHRIPVEETERGSRWPENWPRRLQTPPYWLNSTQRGIYGRLAPQDFDSDYKHWKNVVSKSYMKAIGIDWENVRNVMDMRAVYGGFAAALKDRQVWVMNIVNIDSPDTLPIIFERGLFGIYHDWCESFSTYPRTYDLLHADHLFSKLKTRCRLRTVLAEVDRIVRPGGKLIVRDESSAIGEVENILKSLRWEVHLTFSKDQEGLLSAQKGDWRPQNYTSSS